MDDIDQSATIADPLLACCLCRRLLQEAVMLTCLHNCCWHCYNTAASRDSSKNVGCGLCGTVTRAGSEQRNRFIDCEVQRHKSITEYIACGMCKENGDRDKPAVLWCPACQHLLCGDCDVRHGQYFRQHVTQSLEELRSLHEVCSLELQSAGCAIHNKPKEIACVNCEQTMCISCWAECKEKKHEMHIVGEETFDTFVDKFITNLSTVESELLMKSKVLERPMVVVRDTKAAQGRHLKELSMRKRRVMDAVETAYQQIELSTRCAYEDIKADGKREAVVADRISSAVSDARSYIHRLVESSDRCEILNQHKSVQERLSVLSGELDSLNDRLSTTTREVKTEASLPEDLEEIVRAWIGMPLICSASSSHPYHLPQPHVQQQQCFTFGPASVNVQLHVTCRDVALTKDGRSLLLAAKEHGLLEFSSSCGHELSRWRPPKYSTRNGDDEVWAVAALSCGQAAVSLRYAQLVVLLQRNGQSGSSSSMAEAAGDAWAEYLRFDPLPWPVRQLSAHDDVLAASEQYGSVLQLLSLNSERRLSDAVLQREYKIGSLAVAAALLVNGSSDKVELGDGRRAAHVLDAHSLAEDGHDERLWRHVLSSNDENEDEERLQGVCADSVGGCLYAAVCRSDESCSRVCALSLSDGSELQRVVLSFESAVLPWRLSLSDCGAAAEQQRQRRDSGSSSGGGRSVLLVPLHHNQTLLTVHRSTSKLFQ